MRMERRNKKRSSKTGEARSKREEPALAEYINVDVTFGFLVHIVE